MKKINLKKLIENKALFVINHSGGKDSQAMYLHLVRELKIPFELIRVIHAHLGVMEWDGIKQHINKTTDHNPIIVESHKTFFDMVRTRNEKRPNDPSFPDFQYRQCTSDLKRDPINKQIRKICKEEGFSIVVSCMGIRAEESENRKKMIPWQRDKKQCTKSRDWFKWFPIHSWKVNQVFDTIERHGQEPFWIYQRGMKRCSCKVCIFHEPEDLRTVRQLDGDEFIQQIAELECETGSTMFRKGDIWSLIEERENQLKLF